MMILTNYGCSNSTTPETEAKDDFTYFVEQFGDIRILKYRLPGFEDLSLQQKEYVYYLSQAALAGRDILWDQNFRYNLLIRKTLEAIIDSYSGDRNSADYKVFMTYVKKVFFANGIHHHYSSDKFIPGFSKEYLLTLLNGSDQSKLPLEPGLTVDKFALFLTPVLFDDSLFARKVEQREGADMVAGSASNFYEQVTQKEVEELYAGKKDPADPRPVSTGLNSKVTRVKGKIAEELYRSGGLYGAAIDEIIGWLLKAATVAESEMQKKEIEILIDYYKTGDLGKWDDYNVAWAGNTQSMVDYINGFIETYEDPLGMKATWEAIVNYTDVEASKRTAVITANAQWFEDNSPIMPQYRKEKVTGVAAKVINIAMLGGDCYPASPLGINLPNADWIRREVGSKSVTLANISAAYDIASQGNGFLEEFAFNAGEVERVKKYRSVSDALHTDLHECVGHASGKLAEGTDPNALKNYASPLEEARADLFALYYMTDKKMTELGLFPDGQAGEVAYDDYLRNGLITQIVRIKPGKDIEQAHMRCRSMISHWVFEKGKAENVVEVISRDSKTYVKINDYQKLRSLFGELLKEIQRIKSEGDFEAGKKLIEEFGVKIDQQLHAEVLDRYAKLNLAPYTGFVNPVLLPVYDSDGRITDVKVEYTDDYLGQMMNYGKNYSYLPTKN
ncbi:MAG: dihydrofolate reductase [Bacteroidetes bacterium GWE2_41_25]|nr:MAG: dihydrofolate reductase [Bacteroidetes bacterium GWA2_40_15]OFX99676.1 MAG: dihydrofolate reductase [Bacteroidetes bacterium GWC2_40_22]OFY12269.1 MAG: dihydrofolate reductase [Bacteroidetes bacterium GWE2_41_25]HAM09897.1 dihydrofolate reductase [Bacteroidales bacterium]HBH84039.1 dihydrofolate reductase [Bacteroidales bacterium]